MPEGYKLLCKYPFGEMVLHGYISQVAKVNELLNPIGFRQWVVQFLLLKGYVEIRFFCEIPFLN